LSESDRPPPPSGSLACLSVVIPARDEHSSVGPTIEHLHDELCRHSIPHEIVVVDDGSTDGTWDLLRRMTAAIGPLRPVRNDGANGFGRAVIRGIEAATGDAVVIVMADESDDCRDVVRYWDKLNEGYDAVFGSRFIAGGGTVDYPWPKLVLNRLFNSFISVLFGLKFNDVTNAFKAYRTRTLNGLRPFLAPHFNLTVELPLKTIVRGYSWTVIPITWRNRREGMAKLRIKEMGARYMFIVLYVWLEKYFSRGDYRKPAP
jgi:dolichol-phosphate mannosyltransferase